MNILTRTEKIRKKAQSHGRYRVVADESGVGYDWLIKFAAGAIAKPRVDNVSKLEDYFNKHNLLEPSE